MTGFQSSVNLYQSPAKAGDVAFNSPIRAKVYNLSSASVPNIVGNAFSITSGGNPDPTSGSTLAGTAAVGGTGGSNGKFAGILINSNEYALFGTSSGPLNPTMALPDNSAGTIAEFGEFWVNVDNVPNVGDLGTYDPADGSISSITPFVNFVGSSSTTTLTVASISSGQIQVGMVIGTPDNPGVTPGTIITALGTGVGGTGTYTISISQSIAGSTAIKVRNRPAPAFSGTATCSTTTLTVASVVSGQVYVGMPVIGAGFAEGTVVTAFGTGVGGTGTYTINTSQTVSPAVAIAATGNIIIPNGVISYYDVAFPGLAVLKLTN